MSLSSATARLLADQRLSDAELLLANDRFASAYYVAGYAVELAIKVIIANGFAAGVIPDKQLVQNTYSHDLEKLIGLSGLNLIAAAPEVRANWLTTVQWSETSRYAMIEADRASNLLTAIADAETGVFQWLKSHW